MATETLTRQPRNAPAVGICATSSRETAVPSVRDAVLRASAAVGALDPDDARWGEVGPLLTAFVDAARRALGAAGSPIGPHDSVAPVLRLRDLAHLATRAAAPDGAWSGATPLVASSVESLQSAARRCPSG